MRIHSWLISFLTLFLLTKVQATPSVPSKEAVCGKWETTDNSLIVNITLEKGQYKATMVWFRDTDGKPLDYWKDVHNPDPALRGRKLHGMSVLTGLKYHSDTNSWEDGTIYDSKHGKYWNAAAYIDKNGFLKVKGYWHFKFIGKTLTFRRI
jgi:uncharacterized protein (DUF2147 family)